MRLLGSSDAVAAPTVHPYEQYRLTAMFRAAQLLAGQDEMPRHGWGNTGLFPDLWEDCLKPLSYKDPGLVDRDVLMRHTLRGLWNGFCAAVQKTRAAQGRPSARYYAEKSQLQLAEAISRQIECRLIFVMRDPRDVLLSSREFNRKRNDFDHGWQEGADVPALIRWQVDRVREDLDLFDRLSGTTVSGRLFRYEDMVGDHRRFVGELSDWLDTDLDVHAFADEMREHGRKHVTSKKPSASIKRWRRELPEDLGRLYADLASDLLDRFDYAR